MSFVSSYDVINNEYRNNKKESLAPYYLRGNVPHDIMIFNHGTTDITNDQNNLISTHTP